MTNTMKDEELLYEQYQMLHCVRALTKHTHSVPKTTTDPLHNNDNNVNSSITKYVYLNCKIRFNTVHSLWIIFKRVVLFRIITTVESGRRMGLTIGTNRIVI